MFRQHCYWVEILRNAYHLSGLEVDLVISSGEDVDEDHSDDSDKSLWW